MFSHKSQTHNWSRPQRALESAGFSSRRGLRKKTERPSTSAAASAAASAALQVLAARPYGFQSPIHRIETEAFSARITPADVVDLTLDKNTQRSPSTLPYAQPTPPTPPTFTSPPGEESFKPPPSPELILPAKEAPIQGDGGGAQPEASEPAAASADPVEPPPLPALLDPESNSMVAALPVSSTTPNRALPTDRRSHGHRAVSE